MRQLWRYEAPGDVLAMAVKAENVPPYDQLHFSVYSYLEKLICVREETVPRMSRAATFET